MGGHDAVYQFRASLQAGSIRGHATGGEIGGIPVGIPTASVMQSTAAPAPATGAGLPPINIEINGATDELRVARAVTDAISDKLRRGDVRIG